jgi:hypothetical protein
MEAEDLYSTKKAEVDYECDLCDRKTPYEFINQTQEQVNLCNPCHKHIKPMPEGIIKNSVVRFLMKNVL